MIYGRILNENNITLGDSYEECTCEPGIEAALNSIVESEDNYNRIMQAVGICELQAYMESGQEVVYESADIKSFMGKIKDFFLKIWEKIKGLFKKFFAMFDSYAKSDKEFVNKYKKQLYAINTRDFEYQGFKFTNMDLDIKKAHDDALSKKEMPGKCQENGTLPDTLSEADIKEIQETIDKLDEEDILEKMRAASIGDSGSMTASEFHKELFMKFRNGEDKKETIDKVNIAELLKEISEHSTTVKAAKNAYKELEKTIKEAIKKVEEAEKALYKKDNDNNINLRLRCVNLYLRYRKNALAIAQTVNGAKLTALKDYNRQCKAVCTKLLTYKPKNESYGYDDGSDFYNEGGFLDSVVMR